MECDSFEDNFVFNRKNAFQTPSGSYGGLFASQTLSGQRNSLFSCPPLKRKARNLEFESNLFSSCNLNTQITPFDNSTNNTHASSLDSQYTRRLSSSKRQLSFSPINSNYGPISPLRSPSSKRNNPGPMDPLYKKKDAKSVYSDRFIPSREGSNLENGYQLPGSPKSRSMYAQVLETQMFGSTIDTNSPEKAEESPSVRTPNNSQYNSPQRRRNVNNMEAPNRVLRFRYLQEKQSPKRKPPAFGLSPISVDTQKMLLSPRRNSRKIPKSPFKVLDAPQLTDDFYLNLVDWSNTNVLSVGLGPCVYLWSACTSKVTKLTELGDEQEDGVCSVSWSQRGNKLAVGTRTGEVQIWDGVKCKLLQTMSGHIARVGTLAWNGNILASGSRDRNIFLRDPRTRKDYTQKLIGHKQEVCGLKWSFDEQHLASGGNDNKLLIWSVNGRGKPLFKFTDHKAAVKAIAWSPHQHGLLASGGGTADRCIRFWNTLTSANPNVCGNVSPKPLQVIDTGSQVCNLLWSKNVNEIVSTHGYSLNQIIIWKYPSMTKLATLTGHTYRVLYLANSPDGQTIVTGAGDETLRFWNVFPGSKIKGSSVLGAPIFSSPFSDIR